jgi:DNA-binding NarL/FixJ family response regulator
MTLGSIPRLWRTADNLGRKDKDTVKGNPVRVLCIEDSHVQAELVREMLDEATRRADDGAEFQVVVANRLEDGLERLGPEPVDVVLTDLDLPDSRSMTTYMRIRNSAPHLPIVVLTGCESVHVARDTLRAGAEDYLFKDEMTPEVLARAVVSAMERNRYRVVLDQARDELLDQLGDQASQLETVGARLQRLIAEHRRLGDEIRRVADHHQSVLDSFPLPVMIIDDRRVILTANRAAREAGGEVDEYCWRGLCGSRYLSPSDRGHLAAHEDGPPPNDLACSFCRADAVLASGEPVTLHAKRILGGEWDLWWARVEEGVFLHFLIESPVKEDRDSND